MQFIAMIDLLSTIIQPVSVAYVRTQLSCCRCCIAEIFTDRLSDCFDDGRIQAYTHTLLDADCSDIRSPSICLHRASDVGHVGWMVFYVLAIPALLVLPPIVLVLEDRRFLMGSDTICACRAHLSLFPPTDLGTSPYGPEPIQNLL